MPDQTCPEWCVGPTCEGEHNSDASSVAATGGIQMQWAVRDRWNAARIPMAAVYTVFRQHPTATDDAPSVGLVVSDADEAHGELEVLLRAHEARALIEALTEQLERISSTAFPAPTN